MAWWHSAGQTLGRLGRDGGKRFFSLENVGRVLAHIVLVKVADSEEIVDVLNV
jgi:hypothetical protein